MKLRDTLNTQENYQEIIDKKKQYIDEDLIRISERKEDEKNGIQKYPKPNKEIIISIKKGLLSHQRAIFEAKYSIGEPVIELKGNYLSILSMMKESWQAEWGYVQIVEELSIGIMFEIEDDEINKLIQLIERDNVNDYLIDTLIRYRNPKWQQTEKFLWNKRYKSIAEVVELSKEDKGKALERLKKYLNEWYKSIEIKTHESKWNIHTGYWCWEAGALVRILNLDDSSLKDQQYYPYDMVHWKD